MLKLIAPLIASLFSAPKCINLLLLKMQTQSREIASMVKSTVEGHANIEQSTAPPTYDEAIQLRDQIEDVKETTTKIMPLTSSEITDIQAQDTFLAKYIDVNMRGTKTWDLFLLQMRQFVFPTVKQYIQANFEGAWIEGTEVQVVACRVKWELESFREEELDPDDDVASVLTISGRPDFAEALPCGEYMKRKWPNTGEKLLQALLDLSKYNSSGKPTILNGARP